MVVDALKIAFPMINLTQKWTQSGYYFLKSFDLLLISKKRQVRFCSLVLCSLMCVLRLITLLAIMWFWLPVILVIFLLVMIFLFVKVIVLDKNKFTLFYSFQNLKQICWNLLQVSYFSIFYNFFENKFHIVSWYHY